MTTHFAEVLVSEHAALAQVTSPEGMACWRLRVVRELTRPESRYAAAIRQATAGDAGRDFLSTWHELLASAIERVLRSAEHRVTAVAHRPDRPGQDAERLAVSILAALHGGSTLSRVAEDPAPLDAALDLALAPVTASPPGDDPGRSGTTGQ